MMADQLLLQLRSDFQLYARRCLRIRTKPGEIAPLILNRAQLYVHERLESQLRERGYVRALILKGRQQGMCLDPSTPVLTADLRWVRIDSLKQGDELVACDEGIAGGRGGSRKMRTAAVEKIWRTRRAAYRIAFDDGRSVVCSAEHRWLSKKSQTQAVWRSIGGGRDPKSALKVGDSIRGITSLWGEPDLGDAWFGGMIDGEGSLDYATRSGADLAVSQRAGAVLDRMTGHCRDRGYEFCLVADAGERKTKLGQLPVYAISISNMPALFRLMGLSRPTRFIGQRWWDGKRLPNNGWREIVSIEPVGEMDLVDIQTSTGTFVANGFVSHNSTYIGGRYYWRASGEFGKKVGILTHRDDATTNLFDMVRRYHDLCPDEVKPATKNNASNALNFSALQSGYSVATAGAPGTGRSATIQLFHGSEAGFWPNAQDHMMGIGQTVPLVEGSELVLESTANGIGNMFHKMWQAAEAGLSEFEAIFVPWFWQDEYRKEPAPGFRLTEEEDEYMEAHDLDIDQIAWRRMKIVDDFGGDVLRFQQEYPATAAEAFVAVGTDSYIKQRSVMLARKAKVRDPVGALVLGVDPARFGKDATALIRRRGRKAFKPERFYHRDTMHVAGLIAVAIREEKIDRVFIDVGGLGAGIYDRLVELKFGHMVTAVNFGESAMKEDRYVNRRSEMWGDMREWLEARPCEIPDDDTLHADLIGPQYEYDSTGRVKLESKDKMKKRGIKSPDLGDALALTHAHPVQIEDRHRDKWKGKLRPHTTGHSSPMSA